MSVTPASVKKTQESLGKYVKKPPLTDKLLNKPPFRFLHDVISAVIRETGFFHGLYNEVENKSENVKGMSLINQYLIQWLKVLNTISTWVTHYCSKRAL